MKTYIAPKTENVMFGTSYLMQDPVITMNSTSGGSTATTGDLMFIN
jgi:hypothetical protein